MLSECWFVPPPHSRSLESAKPLDKRTTGGAWRQLIPGSVESPGLPQHAQTPSEHRAAEQHGLDASPSGPGLRGADQIRTEAPRPQQPTAGTRTTEPPFIGDAYMSEEIPPQTVSVPPFFLH